MSRNWWAFVLVVVALVIFADFYPLYKRGRVNDSTTIASLDWHKQILENSKHGRMKENQKILADLLRKEGIKVADDEVCTLDLKTWKITIGKLKEEPK